MLLVTPDYYEKFHCLAGACPDSCCHEWEVDIDEDTAKFYRSLPGQLGERLRSVLREEDGCTLMTIQQGRCPMWREDGLCRIQAELGHEALSQVCRDYPRLRHNYGRLTELGLELSCPEAARLILREGASATRQEKADAEDIEPCDEEALAILLESRAAFLALLEGNQYTPGELLMILLLYGCQVQNCLDGGEKTPLDPDSCCRDAQRFAQGGNMADIVSFFQSLEILTDRWRQRLERPCPGPWQRAFPALIRYFVERYWLQAVWDYDLMSRVKLTVISCLLIRHLGGDLVETAQLFSKEIENDPDNLDAIFDAAYTCPAFTDRALLGLLRE